MRHIEESHFFSSTSCLASLYFVLLPLIHDLRFLVPYHQLPVPLPPLPPHMLMLSEYPDVSTMAEIYNFPLSHLLKILHKMFGRLYINMSDTMHILGSLIEAEFNLDIFPSRKQCR